MMGMDSPKKVEKPFTLAPVANPSVNPISTDPNAILQKLNDKNNDFISAYNASALEQRMKEEPKPARDFTAPVLIEQ